MEKSKTRRSSPDSDSEVPFAHPSTILQQVIEYVLLSNRNAGTPSATANAEVRPSGFSDDLGRAVTALIAENRQRGVHREIADIVALCEKNVSSNATLDALDNKILNYGHYLSKGDEHDCLMYFAIICEMVVTFSLSRAACMITRVVHEAKENMFMYADLYESYIHVDTYAKRLLAENYSDPSLK